MINKITDNTYQVVCDKCKMALSNPFVIVGNQPRQTRHILCNVCTHEHYAEKAEQQSENKYGSSVGTIVLLILSGFLLMLGYASGNVNSMIAAVFLLGIANVLMGLGK